MITSQLQTRETHTMPNTRLPDARPPRRDDSITSASSHPELLIGEIILRPHVRIRLSAAERAALSTWRRRVLAVYALLAAALTGYLALTPGTKTIAQGVSKDDQARAETCVQQPVALSDAADRPMPGQVTKQDTMPACAPADGPAGAGRPSTRQLQAN
jgi:hypothetical protein